MADVISREVVIDAGRKVRLSASTSTIIIRSASSGKYIAVGLNKKQIGDTMKRVSKEIFCEK